VASARSQQVAKKTPARKAAKATPAPAVEEEAPAPKPRARKAPAAKATTRGRGGDRTAVSPAAVEETAVQAAGRRRRAPDPNRPAAVAARAMRGETVPAPEASLAEKVDARVEQLRAEARAETTTADGDPEGTVRIPFRDRNLLVRLPSEEQLTMYRRVSREFAALGASGRADRMSMEEALKYLDRAVRTVQSVLVDDDDREWIEDMLMDRKLKLVDCTDLLKESFRRLAAANGNRESRRAAGQRGSVATLED